MMQPGMENQLRRYFAGLVGFAFVVCWAAGDLLTAVLATGACIAVVNGPTARTLQVPLSFLGAGDHNVMLVRDDPNDPVAVRIENGTTRRIDTLTIDLRTGGGFIARFTRR